jgi:hypothetical protein
MGNLTDSESTVWAIHHRCVLAKNSIRLVASNTRGDVHVCQDDPEAKFAIMPISARTVCRSQSSSRASSAPPVRRWSNSDRSSPRPVRTQATAAPQASNAAKISRNIDIRLSPSNLDPTMINYRTPQVTPLVKATGCYSKTNTDGFGL